MPSFFWNITGGTPMPRLSDLLQMLITGETPVKTIDETPMPRASSVTSGTMLVLR
jgi:hypothetical protein